MSAQMARITLALGLVTVLAFFEGAAAQATASPWGQCGGQGWTGPTLCPSGWSCIVSNQWYSQCLQGAITTTATTTSRPVTTTTSKPTTFISTTTSKTSSTSTTTASGSSGTLLPGYYWIRAVTDPDFHKYLRSSAQNAPGIAILGPPATAGQFVIDAGQLKQYLPGGGFLYAIVEARADSTVNKLKVSFSTSPATSGTFSWSGDALIWNIPGITRSNAAAWLTCEGAEGRVMYINLGAYGYQTPAGCVDHTIHYYNDSVPNA